MRTIKFRAWDKINNEMRNDIIDFRRSKGIYMELITSLDTVLMQFTGLIDSKGKEIYEGDFVKRNDDDKNIHQVKYGEQIIAYGHDWLGIGFYCDEGDDQGSIFGGSSMEVIEVVGNVYENPEMLNRVS